MQSSKDRRRSSNSKHGSGYYQFTFEPEFSDSDDDEIYNLSPKELVDRALRDTELDTRLPEGYTDDAIPEPDFSIEFLHDSRDSLHVPDISHGSDDVSTDSDDVRAETPESLHSPLDHPDSGYIEFVQPRSGSSLDTESARSPSEGFEDDFNVPNYGRLSDDGAKRNSADSLPSPKHKSLPFLGSKNNNSMNLPNVVFRRFKNEFNKLEEDRFIDDDDILPKSSPEFVQGLPREVEMQKLERNTFSGPNPSDRSREAQPGNPYLPMPQEVDQEHDAMVDPERGRTETDDISPIIFVDQTTLSQRAKARRRKIIIVIGVLAAIFGLAGLSAIAYFVVKFIDSNK